MEKRIELLDWVYFAGDEGWRMGALIVTHIENRKHRDGKRYRMITAEYGSSKVISDESRFFKGEHNA